MNAVFEPAFLDLQKWYLKWQIRIKICQITIIKEYNYITSKIMIGLLSVGLLSLNRVRFLLLWSLTPQPQLGQMIFLLCRVFVDTELE